MISDVEKFIPRLAELSASPQSLGFACYHVSSIWGRLILVEPFVKMKWCISPQERSYL